MLNADTEEAGAKIDLFNKILDDSVFVANKISKGSEDSDNLVTSICLNVRGRSLNQNSLDAGIQDSSTSISIVVKFD